MDIGEYIRKLQEHNLLFSGQPSGWGWGTKTWHIPDSEEGKITLHIDVTLDTCLFCTAP